MFYFYEIYGLFLFYIEMNILDFFFDRIMIFIMIFVYIDRSGCFLCFVGRFL